MLTLFYGLGQRVSQLTYNFRNLVGNGAFEPHDDGISEFGATIVERMNRVGMAVDCGHAGDRTMLDAFEISKRPVIISHGNCRALNPGHPRCVTDEAIQAHGQDGRRHGHQFHQLHGQGPRTHHRGRRHRPHRPRRANWWASNTSESAAISGIESNDFAPPEVLKNMLQRADKRYRVHHREAVGRSGRR